MNEKCFSIPWDIVTHTEIGLYEHVSTPDLKPIEPLMSTGGYLYGVTAATVENDHSLPSIIDVKNAWRYSSAPPLRVHGVVLSKAWGRLNLTV